MFNRRLNIVRFAGTILWLAGLMRANAAETMALPETPRLSENLDPSKAAEPDAQTDLREGGDPQFPYSQVIKSPQSAYDRLYYSSSYSGRLEPKAGGARLEFPPDLLQLGLKYNSPFRTGMSPTNAEIRLGRFSLDILSLSSSLLYSDNSDRTEFNRKGGFINIVDLDVLGTMQFTDRLRLDFKAGLIYLPLENKFGLAGFTRDPFSGRLFYGSDPYMLTKFSYDLELSEWHLRLYDNLRSLQALFSDQFDFIGGNNFDEEDRTGRYAFRSRLNILSATNNFAVNQTDKRYTESFIQVRNTAGGSIDRLLPTETRFEAGAFHSDMFYYGTASTNNFPRSRDVGYVAFNSERESMRFKPFISYHVFRSNSEEGSQEARGGVSGPISENLHFVGSAGYTWLGTTGSQRSVADVRLRHTIGPYTFQQVRYHRDLTYPELDLENSFTYRIHQTLGPYVSADAYMKYATFEDLNHNNTGTEEWRTGLHFTISPSSKTTFRVGGIYSRVKYDNSAIGQTDQWTAVGQMRRLWGDSLETVFTYQYQNRDTSSAGDTYYENLFVLTVTYYFGERHVRNSSGGTQPFNGSALQNGGGN